MKTRTISMALAGALLLGCGADQAPEGTPADDGAMVGADDKADTVARAATLPPRETLARYLARAGSFFPEQGQTRAVAWFYTQDRVTPATHLAIWGVDVTNRKVLFQITVEPTELSRALAQLNDELLAKQVASTGPGGRIFDGIYGGSAGQIKGPPPPPPPVGDELFAQRLLTAGTRVIQAQLTLLNGSLTAGPTGP